jgi:hypothetical protein
MSHMNELSQAIDELRNTAAALTAVADSLTQLFSGEESATEEPAPKLITKEEVRAELAAKSAAGYGAQVRALLKRYGAAQLSAVNPDDYASLLLEAQAIGTEGGASAPTKPEDSRRLPQGCTQRCEAVMGETEVDADG